MWELAAYFDARLWGWGWRHRRVGYPKVRLGAPWGFRREIGKGVGRAGFRGGVGRA
jgi:hypothetical protein